MRFRFTAPDGNPAGIRVLHAMDADGRIVGNLDYQLCATCQVGFVSNIAVATHWQGRGVGRDALSLILDGADGYHWTTSRQSAQGRRFFAALADETGLEFVERGERCGHMTA
ncbi:N-acetyltransferase [Streptomyces sp. LHD-70]|uniref:N-acetyltransferase n=1 Tax=Streptomyces sp. LHD-70 TaxID=3072140 RepID=UPI00280F8221|nr:N-acetyltransferase [Streptomyces sp. LHD-70]MDQ8708194.1 N-acetyltransferase [Streptomyces sp. LHD-70]